MVTLEAFDFSRGSFTEEIIKYVKKLNSKEQQNINRKNIISLYIKGLNWKQILICLPDISKNTIQKVIRDYCKRKDLKYNYINDNTYRNSTIIELFNTGISRKEICIEINLKKSIVDGVIRRYLK